MPVFPEGQGYTVRNLLTVPGLSQKNKGSSLRRKRETEKVKGKKVVTGTGTVDLPLDQA